METILWIKLIETTLCKIRMDNLMENNTLDQTDGNYTLENWYGQFYGKGGLDWANLWSLRMYGEQRDTYGTTICASESRIAKRSEANTTRSSQCKPMEQPFGATCANERSEGSFCYKCERTNEVSEHMLQK